MEGLSKHNRELNLTLKCFGERPSMKLKEFGGEVT